MLAGAIQVDRAAGIIRNVAIITAGTTKPSGGGSAPFDVDATTLQQVAMSINANAIGIKSRMTHPEIEGRDDIGCRLGYIRNARVEGNAVRADMHFHNPASNEAITLMSIAEADPASCGLSIVDFDARTEQGNSATGIVLRVESIDAVDWVGEPAANPAGMLSAASQHSKERGNTVLNPQQIEYLIGIGLPAEANAEAIAAFYEGLDESQKAAVDALAAVGVETEVEPVAAEAAPDEEKPKPVAASAKPKAKPAEGVALSQADIAAAIKADRAEQRKREKAIRSIALKANHGEKWINEQIDSDATIGEIALSAINSLNRSPKDMVTTSVSVGADRNRDTLNQAVQDAVLLRAGGHRIVRLNEDGGVMLSANGQPEIHKHHDRAAEFRGRSVIEMGRRYLIALGCDKADSMSPNALASILLNRQKLRDTLPGVFLAQSTGDFPFLLADTMGKVLRSEYALAPHTWNAWCNTRTTPDFKSIKVIQLSEAANLAVIDAGDEYSFAALTEGQESYAVRTQGGGLKFTRQMLINDDLNAFDRVARRLGNAAMRAVESEAISILTANAVLADSSALFSTAHGNLTTGALTAAAAVASIDKAFVAMQTQTALGSDDPLDLQPAIALVPTSLHMKAKVAFASGVDPSLANATPNPIAGENVQVIQSARLNSDSATQWYLLASPSQVDTVEMAFLENEQTPVIEEETDFNSDSLHMKVRHTFRAKAIDYRGMVRGSGA